MEPPYSVPEPRQLTERLRQQWLRVQAQNRHLRCHGSDGKVPDSAVMTTRAGSILVMDYS
jgi:hypothetical protein